MFYLLLFIIKDIFLHHYQDSIRELMKRKQTLTQELRNYEENYRIQNIVDPPVMLNRGKVLNEKGDVYGAIPASTKIKSSLLLKLGDDISTVWTLFDINAPNTRQKRPLIDCFSAYLNRA